MSKDVGMMMNVRGGEVEVKLTKDRDGDVNLMIDGFFTITLKTNGEVVRFEQGSGPFNRDECGRIKMRNTRR